MLANVLVGGCRAGIAGRAELGNGFSVDETVNDDREARGGCDRAVVNLRAANRRNGEGRLGNGQGCGLDGNRVVIVLCLCNCRTRNVVVRACVDGSNSRAAVVQRENFLDDVGDGKLRILEAEGGVGIAVIDHRRVVNGNREVLRVDLQRTGLQGDGVVLVLLAADDVCVDRVGGGSDVHRRNRLVLIAQRKDVVDAVGGNETVLLEGEGRIYKTVVGVNSVVNLNGQILRGDREGCGGGYAKEVVRVCGEACRRGVRADVRAVAAVQDAVQNRVLLAADCVIHSRYLHVLCSAGVNEGVLSPGAYRDRTLGDRKGFNVFGQRIVRVLGGCGNVIGADVETLTRQIEGEVTVAAETDCRRIGALVLAVIHEFVHVLPGNAEGVGRDGEGAVLIGRRNEILRVGVALEDCGKVVGACIADEEFSVCGRATRQAELDDVIVNDIAGVGGSGNTLVRCRVDRIGGEAPEEVQLLLLKANGNRSRYRLLERGDRIRVGRDGQGVDACFGGMEIRERVICRVGNGILEAPFKAEREAFCGSGCARGERNVTAVYGGVAGGLAVSRDAGDGGGLQLPDGTKREAVAACRKHRVKLILQKLDLEDVVIGAGVVSEVKAVTCGHCGQDLLYAVCGSELIFVIALVERDEADRLVDVIALVVILGDFHTEDLFEGDGSVDRFGNHSAVDIRADLVHDLIEDQRIHVVVGPVEVVFVRLVRLADVGNSVLIRADVVGASLLAEPGGDEVRACEGEGFAVVADGNEDLVCVQVGGEDDVREIEHFAVRANETVESRAEVVHFGLRCKHLQVGIDRLHLCDVKEFDIGAASENDEVDLFIGKYRAVDAADGKSVEFCGNRNGITLALQRAGNDVGGLIVAEGVGYREVLHLHALAEEAVVEKEVTVNARAADKESGEQDCGDLLEGLAGLCRMECGDQHGKALQKVYCRHCVKREADEDHALFE